MSTSSQLSVALCLVLSGCTSAGEGNLELTVYGEDFIEVEIPAAAGGEAEGFVDGWSLRFDRFLVAIGAITVAAQDGETGAEDDVTRVFDLHLPGPHPVASFDGLEARRWDRVSFGVLRAGPDTVAGNAAESDVELMAGEGYSIYVEGAAENGGAPITFAWGFSTETIYEECHSEEHGEGVVVPSGGVEMAELTIHGDHLFYDDLQAPDAELRFEAMAGADDGDGNLSLAELETVDLTTLPEGTYGTGGLGSVEDLRAFVAALTRTLGHFRGEGHCHSSTDIAH